MAKKAFLTLTIALAVSLVALVSFTAGATSGSPAEAPAESADGDSGGSIGGYLQRLHMVGFRMFHGGGHDHGGGEFGHHVEELVSRLDLSPEQTERLESIHRTFESQRDESHRSLEELHGQLVEQFQQGHIESDAVKELIDQRVDEARIVAYSVTDDLFALVNSFDREQREIILEHLQGGDGGHHGRSH